MDLKSIAMSADTVVGVALTAAGLLALSFGIHNPLALALAPVGLGLGLGSMVLRARQAAPGRVAVRVRACRETGRRGRK
ncbi:MAG: hypothetical protein ACLQVD_05570 [Capsulimonadaceae bacterium]